MNCVKMIFFLTPYIGIVVKLSYVISSLNTSSFCGRKCASKIYVVRFPAQKKKYRFLCRKRKWWLGSNDFLDKSENKFLFQEKSSLQVLIKSLMWFAFFHHCPRSQLLVLAKELCVVKMNEQTRKKSWTFLCKLKKKERRQTRWLNSWPYIFFRQMGARKKRGRRLVEPFSSSNTRVEVLEMECK